MATSVKISREYKEKLDRLQARLYLTTGKKLSLQELLETLITLGSYREEIVAAMAQSAAGTLTPEEVKAILDSSLDWGVETSEEEIEDTLYRA